jgi:hypothetical protein
MAVLKREREQWAGCPDAEVCKSCPCASDDDVCFPGERLRAEHTALVRAMWDVLRDYPRRDLPSDVKAILLRDRDARRVVANVEPASASHDAQRIVVRSGHMAGREGQAATARRNTR